jgi:D-alanyl-D-alanine carboxypeptidase
MPRAVMLSVANREGMPKASLRRLLIASAAKHLLLCTIAMPSFALAQTGSRAKMVASIDSVVAAAMKDGRVAGMAVAVVKGRDTLLFKGYGLADVEDSVPVRPHTVFRIGSVTKQFTSAAIMKLVEQGKLSLDDEMSKYLPDIPTRGRKILVRHLLNHTSGIPSYTDIGPRWGRTIRLDLSHDSLLAIVKNDSLMFDPGANFYYNNTGYYILGVLIEKITGEKYGDYLAKTFFQPLGLRGTMYCDVRPIIRNRADGYDVAPNGQLVNTDYLSMNQPFAAGSLCSTIGDLVTWTRALESGRVVSRASYARMTAPEPLTSKRPMTYGYGLTVDTLGTHRVVSHGGGINGFAADLRHYPDDSLVIAVLSNTGSAPSGQVGAAIARVVLGVPAPAPVPPKDLAMTAADRAPFVGNYLLTQTDGSRSSLRVYERGDSLFAELQNPQGQQQSVRLRWQGGTLFLGPGRLSFDVMGGRATGFVLGAGARTREGVRVP